MAAVTCGRCGTPVPASARFCDRCGSPVVAAPPAAAATYAVASPDAMAHAYPNKSRSLLWVALIGAVAIFGLAFTVTSLALRPPPPVSCGGACTPPPPPVRPPLGNPHTYTSAKYGFSLDYFDDDGLGQVGKIGVNDERSIAWAVTIKSVTFPVVFLGDDAAHRTPQQVVDDIQRQRFPNATPSYVIPGAELGYTEGYGRVYDIRLATSGGQAVRSRLILMAAVKKDVAVAVVLVGPYVPSTREEGHPNPANTPFADLIAPVGNTVRFKGDPPL